jgi:hypothetical protein
MMYIDSGKSFGIIFANQILQKFDETEFVKCLTTLLSFYFVYNIPFNTKNEKILGFFLEATGFPEANEYEKPRNKAHLNLLNELKI